eukprot:198246-Pelagomonas_calceolata.AAC.3
MTARQRGAKRGKPKKRIRPQLPSYWVSWAMGWPAKRQGRHGYIGQNGSASLSIIHFEAMG